MMHMTPNHSGLIRAILTLTASFAAFASLSSAQTHHAVDLGSFDNTPGSFGFGLNNSGRPVGTSYNLAADLVGFLWDGALDAITPLAGDLHTQALDLNDSGQVVAISTTLGDQNTQGLIWQAGVSTTLSNVAPLGINAVGAVAGYLATTSVNIPQIEHAAHWQGGATTDLGTLGGNFSYASDISDSGQIVGWSYTANDDAVRATLWQGVGTIDLGTLGGATSQAYAISATSGDVVGVADTPAGAPRAFRFKIDAAGNVLSRTDLGELNGCGYSYAYGVNNVGQVVGTSDASAFLWSDSVMIDLNAWLPAEAEWRLEVAQAINDAGQITGTGFHHGQQRAFLLALVGDLNSDGAVDTTDTATFAFCIAGPDVTTPPIGCSAYDFALSDFDGQGDADLNDLGALQTAYPWPQ